MGGSFLREGGGKVTVRERPEWETRGFRREKTVGGSTAMWAKVLRNGRREEWRGTVRMAWLRKGDEASRDDKNLGVWVCWEDFK